MLEPRRWQKEAAALWRQDRRGVLSVVTGAGKTAFALMVFEEMRREQEDLRLIVVVPTIALVDQWFVALTTDGGLNPDQVATYSGEGRAKHPELANLLVINSARALAGSMGEGAPCFFVVDECHRAGSPENAKALRVDAEMTLGLSATPVREFDDGFERYVEPAVGPVIFEYGYADARRDGVIAEFAMHNYKFPLSPEETRQYEGLTSRIASMEGGRHRPVNDPYLDELREKRSRQLVDSPRRTAAAVAVSEQFRGRQILFHERIERANEIAALLDRRGARVAVYHSRLAAGFRRRNLELFKEGQFDLLVTCRALDEGLNVPDAGTAVIAASTSSTRQRIQRLGRVLRPSAGKERADVATLYATPAEEEFLRMEAASLADVAATNWYEIQL